MNRHRTDGSDVDLLPAIKAVEDINKPSSQRFVRAYQAVPEVLHLLVELTILRVPCVTLIRVAAEMV